MSSGTVYIDAQVKDERGNSLVFGRVKVGNNATINPRDLGLRYIQQINFNPWHAPQAMVAGCIGSQATKLYRRGFATVSGSLGSLGVLDTSTGSATPIGNYVRVRSYAVLTLGSMTLRGAGPQGTKALYIGTQAGSLRHGYQAIGA